MHTRLSHDHMQVKYTAAIWNQHTKVNQDKLEMIQRRGATYVCNDYSRQSSMTAVLENLSWLPHSMNSEYSHHTSLQDCAWFVCCVLIPITRQTRHLHPMLFYLTYKANRYINESFLPTTVVQWNILPPNVTTATTLRFFKSNVCELTH